MPPEPPPGPVGLFNVSVMPTFLSHSARAGWPGVFFTSIVGAPEGSVDHVHQRFCLIRTQQALEVRSAPGARWDIVPAGLGFWRPGDEQRGDWRRGGRSQFLFIEPGYADTLLDGGAQRLAAAAGLAARSRVAEPIFDALEADLMQSSPAGPMVGESLLAALIAHIAGAGGATAQRLTATARERALDYIEAHLERPITLAELAGVAGVGVRHLSRSFRASSGESPHAYVLRRRIERAKSLIGSGLALADVALQCGFGDQSQFSRAFLRVAGLTPGRYRSQLRR